MNFSDVLKLYLNKTQSTAKELSAASGISASALSRYRSGKRVPEQEQIEKLRDQSIDGFDFIFVDAAKSHYKRFLEAALTVAADGALIISDNILMRGMTASDEFDTFRKHKTNIRKMREYVEFICTQSDLDTSLMAVGDGLAVTVYKR